MKRLIINLKVYFMTNETKNRWSVYINVLLTAITALLSAFGFNIG